MPRGGKRPGAGRPRGSKTKKTAQLLAAAAAGETPVDFLLRVMRDEAVDASVRMDAAKAVAPYLHPRLASTEVSGPGGDALGPLTIVINRFADGSGLISAGPAGPSHPKTIEHR
jgi:hypothetical protein